RKLLARADMVIVVSPKLLEAKRPYNAHTYLVPNGVDAEAYARSTSPPDDLQSIPEPRILYAGLISARLDLGLIEQLARRRPEWSFVLMGEVNPRNVNTELDRLRQLANVHFLGLKPASVVPEYVLGSQVCWLPYRLIPETQHMDPLKLYEALAAGKPVVAAPIPALAALGAVAQSATTLAEAETALQIAILERDPALEAQRKTIAAQHTWEARVTELSELMQRRLNHAATEKTP
ncbi:MAG: glycosyltransferase, partial [Anaerolineales bacterium]